MINTSDKTVIKIPFVKELLVLVFILAALYFANQVIEEKITMWLFGAVGVILLYLIITKPRTGFLIMIALLPLTAFPKIELGNFLKVSYLISLVLFLGFMAQAAIKKDLRISRTPLDFSFILLFVIAAVSIFQSGYIGEPQYIIRSSWFNLPFNRSFFQFAIFLSMLIPFYLTTAYLDSEEKIKKIIKVWTVAAFLVSVYGLYGFVGYYINLPLSSYAINIESAPGSIPRIQATCEEPIFLGFFLMTIIPVLLAIILSKRKEFYFKHIGIMTLTMLAVLIFTFSRSAWISFILAFLFIVYQYRKVMAKNALKFFSVAGVLVMLFFIVDMMLFQGGMFEYVLARFTGATAGTEFSSLTRLDSLITAYNMFLAYPILGVGIGNFNFHFMDFVPAWHYLIFEWLGGFFYAPTAGNLFLGFLAEMGILGFFAIIWFFISIFKSSFKALRSSWDSKWNPLIVGGIASIIALIINYQFISTFTFCYVWVLFGFIIAVQKLAVKKEDAIPY